MEAKCITNKLLACLIGLIMSIAMIAVMANNSPSHATLYSVPAPQQTDEQISSDSYRGEYYKVRTPLNEDHTIYVEGRTKIHTERFCIRLAKHGKAEYFITVFVTPNASGEFSIKINTAEGNVSVPEVIDGKGTVAEAWESWDIRPGYRAVETIPAGTYHLTIARAKTESEANIAPGSKWYSGPLGGNKGYAYKDTVLTVKSGDENNPKLVKYPAAITNNVNTTNLYENEVGKDKCATNSYVRYTDKYLKDMAFVFKNPNTGKQENLTSSQLSYIGKVADKVTAGATTNYDKLLKMYEFVGSNFYYDVLAFETSKYQYANPYKNLYYYYNKTKSANSVSGKVATTCQGYSAMIIAMARAEGIPARLAYGHHISLPLTVWSETKASDLSKRDHWWAEAWVDGEWIVIDANSATTSKWKRGSFSSTGTWEKCTDINYAYFDPSAEQLSNSYAYIAIYAGATSGKYINNATELAQMRAFLNTKYSGKYNGVRLNKKYSATNKATWGTGTAANLKTDGYGRVTQISWAKKGLYGRLNLSNFSKLKYVTVYGNKITSLNLSNCKNLVSVSASSNRMTAAIINNGSKNIKFARNVAGGTFGLNYAKSSKKVTIFVNSPAKGYKYVGIYNSAGKKLTSKTKYTFKPTGSTYYVKYKKK